MYRSVYGFQLLDDEGNAPVPRHIGEVEEGGVRRWGPAPTADATTTPATTNTTTTTVVDASSVTIVKAVPSATLGASSAAPAPAAPATKESVLARFATMKQQQQQQQPPQQQPPAPAQAATAASQQGGSLATNPLQVPSTEMGEGVVPGPKMEEMFDATIGATAANLRAQHNVAPAGSEGGHDDDDGDAEEEIDIFVGGNPTYPSI